MPESTLSQSLSGISSWFNKHKGILVVIGMPIGGVVTYASQNVVMAQEYQIHINTQQEFNESLVKSISVLDYETQLIKVRTNIDHLLDGVSVDDLDARDKRMLERLEREEARLEELLK